MRTILAGIYVFFFLLLGIPVLAVDWIIRNFNPKLSAYCQLRIVQWGFRCISFLSGIQLTVIGEENVPKDQAVLYIGNHRSIFDIVITYARCPGLTGYISKGSVDKVPVLGIIMRRLYCLFLDREDMKQGLKVILQAIEYIKQGISICVFPEQRYRASGKPSVFQGRHLQDCPKDKLPHHSHGDDGHRRYF